MLSSKRIHWWQHPTTKPSCHFIPHGYTLHLNLLEIVTYFFILKKRWLSPNNILFRMFYVDLFFLSLLQSSNVTFYRVSYFLHFEFYLIYSSMQQWMNYLLYLLLLNHLKLYFFALGFFYTLFKTLKWWNNII